MTDNSLGSPCINVYSGECSRCGKGLRARAPGDRDGQSVRCGSCGKINHLFDHEPDVSKVDK